MRWYLWTNATIGVYMVYECVPICVRYVRETIKLFAILDRETRCLVDILECTVVSVMDVLKHECK